MSNLHKTKMDSGGDPSRDICIKLRIQTSSSTEQREARKRPKTSKDLLRLASPTMTLYMRPLHPPLRRCARTADRFFCGGSQRKVLPSTVHRLRKIRLTRLWIPFLLAPSRMMLFKPQAGKATIN